MSESIHYLQSMEGDHSTYSYYIGEAEAGLQRVSSKIEEKAAEYAPMFAEGGTPELNAAKAGKEALSAAISAKMEAGELQRGSDYFEGGAEYIYPLSMDHYTLSGYVGAFGYRTYYTGSQYISSNHRGIDLAAAVGEPVYAAKAGIVIAAGYENGYGYYIALLHEDGSQTRYAHQTENLVEVGDYVLQGEEIALVGSSGNAAGNLCHFEIVLNGLPTDPAQQLLMPAG